MYICKDCGLIFSEPKHYSEDRTPGGVCEGGSFIEHYEGCPACAGAFDDAQMCQRCSEWCDNNFCDSCIEDIKKEYADIISENFTASEYDTICDCILNPYSDKPYWDRGIAREKARRNEKYLMSFLEKYIKLMKDNFRPDEYDYTEDVEIEFKED